MIAADNLGSHEVPGIQQATASTPIQDQEAVLGSPEKFLGASLQVGIQARQPLMQFGSNQTSMVQSPSKRCQSSSTLLGKRSSNKDCSGGSIRGTQRSSTKAGCNKE